MFWSIYLRNSFIGSYILIELFKKYTITGTTLQNHIQRIWWRQQQLGFLFKIHLYSDIFNQII